MPWSINEGQKLRNGLEMEVLFAHVIIEPWFFTFQIEHRGVSDEPARGECASHDVQPASDHQDGSPTPERGLHQQSTHLILTQTRRVRPPSQNHHR